MKIKIGLWRLSVLHGFFSFKGGDWCKASDKIAELGRWGKDGMTVKVVEPICFSNTASSVLPSGFYSTKGGKGK